MALKSIFTKIMLISITTTVAFANTALSGGVGGTGTIESAKPLEHKTLQFSFGAGGYSGDALGVRNLIDGEIKSDSSYWRDAQFNSAVEGGSFRLDLGFAASYGIFPFLESSLFLPYYKDETFGGQTYSGLGDAVLSFKFNYPPYEHAGSYKLSYLTQFVLPTGNDQSEGGFMRHAYNQTNSKTDGEFNFEGEKIVPGSDWSAYTAQSPVVILKLLNTVDLSAIEGAIPLLIHFGGGLALSDNDHANTFLINTGVEFWMSPMFALMWSLNSEVNVSHANKHVPIFTYPLSNKVAMVIEVEEIDLGFDLGVHALSNNWSREVMPIQEGGSQTYKYYREPKWGAFVGMHWKMSFSAKDSDGDGMIDDEDRCPLEAEDMDDFEDEDGCPEKDNDNDGIPDDKDKCINEMEDQDGFKDDDGCPELDNDMDGIVDNDDSCPMEVEDKDGWEDDDGCPDRDNDKDGIEDKFDQCRDIAEDKDGFEDKDGCPDKDNDKDGIPDVHDKCPDKAENLNGINDSDGCPDKA